MLFFRNIWTGMLLFLVAPELRSQDTVITPDWQSLSFSARGGYKVSIEAPSGQLTSASVSHSTCSAAMPSPYMSVPHGVAFLESTQLTYDNDDGSVMVLSIDYLFLDESDPEILPNASGPSVAFAKIGPTGEEDIFFAPCN